MIFTFRGFSPTVYQNYTILSVILHFADFYFRGKGVNREKRENEMSANKGDFPSFKKSIDNKSSEEARTRELNRHDILFHFTTTKTQQ